MHNPNALNETIRKQLNNKYETGKKQIRNAHKEALRKQIGNTHTHYRATRLGTSDYKLRVCMHARAHRGPCSAKCELRAMNLRME